MRKIPTIFARDMTKKGHPIEADVYRVDPTLLAQATATVKWDGTAVELDEAGRWWVRHVIPTARWVRQGWPPGFRLVHHDPVTHQEVGWVPVDFDAPAHEVIADAILNSTRRAGYVRPGTYEALGPQTGRTNEPHLTPHGWSALSDVPIDYAGLVRFCGERPWMEGIVWWLDGNPIGKVKRFDLGLPWPAKLSVGEQGSTVSTRSPSPADLTLPNGLVGSPTEARP